MTPSEYRDRVLAGLRRLTWGGELLDEALVLTFAEGASFTGEAVVELHLTDGGSITGVVTTRPSVQVFRDGDGHEGFNAVVRIDDHRRPDVTHYLWLDRIASVTSMGSA